MAKRLRTEQMTETPSDDTPSTSGQTSRQTLGFDDVIIKVAKAVSDDGDVMRLGLELGVQIPDINRALETNWAGGRKTSNGNVMLLQNWSETINPSKQLPILRAALQAAGFKEIAETCLQGKAWIPFAMAKRLRTEQMTETPSDDTSSTSGKKSRQTHGFDDVIIKVAKAISDDADIRRLGLELGVQTPDINRALETNWAGGRNTSNGNVILLQNWAATVIPSDQLPILRAALQTAGLKEIAETCLQRKGEHGEMPDKVQRLKEKLKARYIEEFSEVKVSPMDPESRTWLQHIFVSLILMLGCKRDQKKEIRYDDLFSFIQKKTDKGFITRLAFLGEAGVGKSTLFAKIALDWAMGKCLQDITLLFHESCRDIEDTPFFGDIVMNHFPDDTEIIGEWIDKYIKENQRKVLILLDGLDEAKTNIKCPNRKLAIVSIARRERFIDTSVLISSRPFGADQIKSIPKIDEKYSYILVEGFTKENTNKYIKQFFEDDTASASSLIHFINTSSVVSEFMAPFPIFCCMLCYMWKVESKRKTTEKLQTISQLMKEIDFALREQYSSRYTDIEGGYQCHMQEAVKAITKVGRVAFEGLLKNQLIFTKEEMEACDEAAAVACQVGILSGKKRLASKEVRQKEGKQFIQEFCFPHKLLQEHTASLYLASLFYENRQEFNRILADTLLEDYKEFRYVLYFTAAHGGEVGKSVLEALCKKVDDMGFIIQCAFECHDSEAIEPVRNLLKTETHLNLPSSLSTAAFLYTLEPMGKEVVRRSSSIRETLGVGKSFKANASPTVAVGLFTLQKLRRLDINLRLDETFYLGMSAAASQSKIVELEHWNADLGSAASSHYARGLCSMQKLRSLYLYSVKLSDTFYSTMASEASKSKIVELQHWNADLCSAASSHYARGLCSMPNLRSLYLHSVKLSDTFYSTMASEASKSKIEKLTHYNADLESNGSSHYARGLCFMPNLRSLYLYRVKTSDTFYTTMAYEASKSKIEELKHEFADLGSTASFHYARGLCSMQNLRSLNLDCVKLSDEFYSTMASEASKSKIEKLKQNMADLGSRASSHYARGLCSMPNLRSLRLNSVKLNDEFYSAMASEASKSKIEELNQWKADLGPDASSHYARGLCFMPNLRSLYLDCVKLSDEFYSKLASEASKSKIEELTQKNADLGSHASSHYARGLCSMPKLRSLDLDCVKLSDEFYSAMASEASKSKLEELTHDTADLGSQSSSHYARGLCLMPNLRSLGLYRMKLSDEFYSTMASEASTSNIEELSHDTADLGSHSSSHYARGLCLMPNLRSLSLFRMKLSDEFYSTMASEASTSMIEMLNHWNADLGSLASAHYARGLCTMPNLRSLNLDGVKLSDEFYSTMLSEASGSKIENHNHWNADLGSVASSHYARGLCTMPNLQSLDLDGVKLSDEFYSAMASEASKSKIEELKHFGTDLGSAASSHYARGLCSMPKLRSLDLDCVKLSDEFYSTMASEASNAKIEELTHKRADLGSTASSRYARGLCTMPNLRSLNLDGVKLSDEFYSTMLSEASKSKIQTLSMGDVSITPCRLHSILSLPRLQSLSLRDIRRVDMGEGETLTRQITSINELSVDGKHVTCLWNLGLHTSCPRVETLKLDLLRRENVSSDIVTKACSLFHHLTHLHIQGYSLGTSSSTPIDPVSFCHVVKVSCPRLTKLSISNIILYSEKAAKIIQLMKTHPHLTSIALDLCHTNADLDPLISEVNSEGKLTVTVKHGGRRF